MKADNEKCTTFYLCACNGSQHRPRGCYNSVSYLFLHSPCFWKVREAAVSGLVNEEPV